ncbi:hypothetical protein AAMO2058_001726900 [Amorphochlora amoebiformis]
MDDPVVTACQTVYDYRAIVSYMTKASECLSKSNISDPTTGERLRDLYLIPHLALRKEIRQWREKRPKHGLKSTRVALHGRHRHKPYEQPLNGKGAGHKHPYVNEHVAARVAAQVARVARQVDASIDAGLRASSGAVLRTGACAGAVTVRASEGTPRGPWIAMNQSRDRTFTESRISPTSFFAERQGGRNTATMGLAWDLERRSRQREVSQLHTNTDTTQTRCSSLVTVNAMRHNVHVRAGSWSGLGGDVEANRDRAVCKNQGAEDWHFHRDGGWGVHKHTYDNGYRTELRRGHGVENGSQGFPAAPTRARASSLPGYTYISNAPDRYGYGGPSPVRGRPRDAHDMELSNTASLDAKDANALSSTTHISRAGQVSGIQEASHKRLWRHSNVRKRHCADHSGQGWRRGRPEYSTQLGNRSPVHTRRSLSHPGDTVSRQQRSIIRPILPTSKDHRHPHYKTQSSREWIPSTSLPMLARLRSSERFPERQVLVKYPTAELLNIPEYPRSTISSRGDEKHFLREKYLMKSFEVTTPRLQYVSGVSPGPSYSSLDRHKFNAYTRSTPM